MEVTYKKTALNSNYSTEIITAVKSFIVQVPGEYLQNFLQNLVVNVLIRVTLLLAYNGMTTLKIGDPRT